MASHNSPQPRTPYLRDNLEIRWAARRTAGRPIGIAALVALHLLAAVVGLLSAILLILFPPVPLLGIDSFQNSTVQVLLLLLVVPLNLSVAIGLWMLKNWARFLAFLLYALIVVVVVLTSTDRTYGPASLLVLVNGAAFFYLWRPEVRAAFTNSLAARSSWNPLTQQRRT